MDDQLVLMEPSESYAADIWAFREEVMLADADNEDCFAGCMSLDTCASAEEWINICRARRHAETCLATGVAVPSDMFIAVRKDDGKVVGVIDLRHHIDHPVLGTWGGHCGYTVRPSERGKGYAKAMLRLNLAKAALRGMDRLLVTCNANNPASEKVIQQNGGVYESTLMVEGDAIKRYWISTQR